MFFYYIDLSIRSIKSMFVISVLMVFVIVIGIGLIMISFFVFYMMLMDFIFYKS